MDNHAKIKFEIELAANKIISQVMVNNSIIEEQLTKGIKAAVEEFNFETHIKLIVTREIDSVIRNSNGWDAIRTLVKQKADIIINEYLEKQLTILRKDLNL